MKRQARRLDLVVPIYKNAGWVRRCVDSLLSHRHEVAAVQPGIVLIDDSPADDEVARLLASYDGSTPDLRVLRNATNRGFVATVNRGIALALEAGHDVLLVNSDTVTYPGALAALLSAAAADPQIGFASPRSNNASICSLPHHSGELAMTPDTAHRRWQQLSRTMPPFHFVPTAVGFYLYIAHAVLADAGAMREEFGVGYEEENDLIMRAGKLGYRAVLANHAFVFHAGSASFDLTDIDLAIHRSVNLKMQTRYHPEFAHLMTRYERSPHVRAERLLRGLLAGADGKPRIVFDLTGLATQHGGAVEQAVGIVGAFARRHGQRLRVAVICSELSLAHHGLDRIADLHREEPGAAGLHAVAVRLAQPFEWRDLDRLKEIAPINVYGMPDTIAEDCGPLAAAGSFLDLWRHVSHHASGLVFVSRFAEASFSARHPTARTRPCLTRLLPTRLASYSKPLPPATARHVLVLGDEFPHTGAEAAVRTLAAAFPDVAFTVSGSQPAGVANISRLVPGDVAPPRIGHLLAQASLVVLPSHLEGFNFAFMQALAAGRPIVARRIAATEEILATLRDVQGVHLFDDNADLLRAFTAALPATASSADDSAAAGWDEWVDALGQFCLALLQRDDIFEQLVRRLADADLLQRTGRATAADAGAMAAAPAGPGDGGRDAAAASAPAAADLESLLALAGRQFVEQAYATLLRRPADNAGLEFYLAQLQDGVAKRDIVRALAISPEGRARDVQLDGLPKLIAQQRNTSIFKRLFGN